MKAAALANRTMGAFPLSIGTSLAFESIFENAPRPPYDPARLIPQKVNIAEYEEMWINLSTLNRNIIGSLAREDAPGALPREIADVIYQEMDFIVSLLQNEGNKSTRPIFYACDYSSLENKYRNTKAQLRADNTENQKIYSATLKATLQLVFKEITNKTILKAMNPKLKPEGTPKTLLLSHAAYDLTSKNNFRELHLIESHTGLLRKPPTWYVKYYHGKELTMIPFMEGLLPVFGDNETFAPMAISIRREIIEIAKAKAWTQVTTPAKVLFDLNHSKNQFLIENIKLFF